VHILENIAAYHCVTAVKLQRAVLLAQW